MSAVWVQALGATDAQAVVLWGAPGSFGGCRDPPDPWLPNSIADQGLEGVTSNHKCPQITKSPAITAKMDTGLLDISRVGRMCGGMTELGPLLQLLSLAAAAGMAF